MSRRLNQQQFEEKVYNTFGNKYSVISEYLGHRKPVTLHCNIHNLDFTATAECFMRNTNDIRSSCPECSAEKRREKNNSVKCECAYCHKIFYLSQSKANNSKSGLHFCCREHKDLAQRIDSGKIFDIMRPPHYSSTEENVGSLNTYRSLAFRNYSHKCAICGWDEDEDILQVHHIDENRQNNSLSNLIILCPNCHAKLTYGKYKLINRKEIISK